MQAVCGEGHSETEGSRDSVVVGRHVPVELNPLLVFCCVILFSHRRVSLGV